MKKLLLTGLLSLTAVSLMAADAKEDVSSAIKKLKEKQNYSWNKDVQNDAANAGGGGGGRRGFGGPSEGKVDKDVSWSSSTIGQNSFEVAIKGSKSAIKRQDAWVSTDEAADAAGGQQRPNLKRMVESTKKPAEEAEGILQAAKEVKKEGDVYVATLSDEGIKDQALGAFRRNPNNTTEFNDGKGTAKFWVKDGVLVKYEVNIQGKMKGSAQGNDFERDVNRTTKVDIKEVGTTKIELPQEAKDKLS